MVSAVLGADIQEAAGNPLLGAWLALGAAFVWAVATALWAPAVRRLGAIPMNFFKCVLCAVYLWCATLFWLGPEKAALFLTPAGGFLMVSGIVGLSMGDGFLFATLRILGAQPAAVLLQLSPIWAAAIGLFLLDEVLTPLQYGAILAVSLGVALVVIGRRGGMLTGATSVRTGVIFGVSAALLNAGGFALAKHGITLMAEEETGSPGLVTEMSIVLVATTMRMTAAAVTMVCYAWANRKLNLWLGYLLDVRSRSREYLAVFLGTFLGVFLSQAALVYVPTSVAISLCSTTPLFLLPMAVFMLGERYRWIAVLGTLLAVAGIPLLMIQ